MTYKVVLAQHAPNRWNGAFIDQTGAAVGACGGNLEYVLRVIMDFAKDEGMSITGPIIELTLTTTDN